MDWKLELIVVPVADIDRAKAFYAGQAGFTVNVDHSAGEDFRVVQLTPPGSACSIALMRNLEAAHAELTSRGAEVSDYFHFGPTGQTPGLDPSRADYGSFFSFRDPDGNSWLVQEVAGRS